MARVYDQGSMYGVSLNATEIARFRSRWPASGLGSLRSLYAGFERRNGDLVELECNRRHGCARFDGAALSALVEDAQCLAESKLQISTSRGCSGKPDWRQYLSGARRRRRRR